MVAPLALVWTGAVSALLMDGADPAVTDGDEALLAQLAQHPVDMDRREAQRVGQVVLVDRAGVARGLAEPDELQFRRPCRLSAGHMGNVG